MRSTGPQTRVAEVCGRALAVAQAVVLGTAACAPTNSEDGAVLVLAAASTAQVIEQLAEQFTEREGVEVRVSSAGTNALAAQVLAGVPADLLLAAHEEWSEALAQRGLVAEQRTLVTNELVLAAPRSTAHSASRVTGLADLFADERPAGSPALRVGVAAEGVPAGIYALQALAAHGLVERSEARASARLAGELVFAQNVRGVLAWIERGEVDAGVVYASDAHAAPRAQVVHRFAPGDHEPIRYPWMLLERGRAREPARRFHAFVASDEGRRRFEEQGFGSAPQ